MSARPTCACGALYVKAGEKVREPDALASNPDAGEDCYDTHSRERCETFEDGAVKAVCERAS